MAKHRRQSTGSTRRIVGTAAIAASASVAMPGVAQAAEVHIPNTTFSVEVEGVETLPGVRDIPGIADFIPALAVKAPEQANNNYAAAVAAPAPAPAPSPQEVPAPVEPSVGERVVAAARSATGAPYAWGAAGPDAFDCSGLTSWAYAQVGKRIPRTSQAQAAQGQQIALADIQPGDIVSYYSGASHVGIYAGNGVIIDSLDYGYTVGERPLHYMPIHSIVRF